MPVDHLERKIQRRAPLPHHPHRARLRWYFRTHSAFAVTYEVTGKILHTDEIGPLVDKINRKEGTHIDSLEWQSL
jgi:hypothetical protein